MMSKNKVLNFDLFMQEKRKETMTVTLYGVNYEVPMEIPAIVPVMMARAENSLDDTQSTMMIMRAADAMLGADVVDELCRKGMSGRDLSSLVQKMFHDFSHADDGDDEAQDVSDEDSRVAAGGKREKK